MQATEFSIGFIGGGNMATAMIIGLKNQGFKPEHIQVVELDEKKRKDLEQQFQVNTTHKLATIVNQDVIVLAIKPQQLKSLALELAPLLKTQLIITIAAGIRLKDLSKWLNDYPFIIRAMPNTPAQIQAGVTGLFAMPKVTQTHRLMANTIINATGLSIWLEDEASIDAVTAISGSGPAYVFYLIEALQEAAVKLGLSAEQAKILSLHTFKGASLLAEKSTLSVENLRAQVTSKGGTTEQGILSLEQSQVKQAILSAAQAAEKRAKILGEELGNS